MHYYIYLCRLKAEGLVTKFELQPKVVLIPSITCFDGSRQREITYKPDFYVEYVSGYRSMVDMKGFSTQQGILRRKMYNWLERQTDSVIHNIPLQWVARSIKYGDEDGFIAYDLLQKRRRENK